MNRHKVKMSSPKHSQQCAIAFSLLATAIACLATPARADLGYTVGGSWPNAAHRAAAENAIQTVTDRYNAYGDFGSPNVYVYYNAGIPTAQASYLGSIGFGGTYPNERVTAHEMAHYLGLPSGNWGSLMSGGTWSGAHGLAKVKQFDGEQATLNGDSIHYWPYGLNFDSEGSETNKQRQVAVVYAMRADLGIGSSTHPAAFNNEVVLTADNPAGQSGFNYKGEWSDGHFAHAGSHYATGDYKLRTPTSGSAYRFYGDYLTVNNTNGAAGGLLYKGQGAAAKVTINSLRLDGGWIQHQSTLSSPFELDGAINVLSDSVFYAKQGDIDVTAAIRGSGRITIETTDSPDQDARYVRFHSDRISFVGDIENRSRFELASGGRLGFLVGPSGSTNSITGATARATHFNGAFNINLSQASFEAGDSWALVTAANSSYGDDFEVTGFEGAEGVWGDGSYSFEQATGLLTIVPTWDIDGGGSWSTAGNWIAGVPLVGGEASFGDALGPANAPAAINVDTPVTLRRLNFDNASPYTLSGANAITLTGAAMVYAKSGDHEIATPLAGGAGLTKRGEGAVTLSAANPFTGDTRVDAGALRLTGGASIAGSSNIEVQAAATLDVSGLSGSFVLGGGQTLNTQSGAAVVGDVVAGAGSSVTGAGALANSLTVENGASLRIGEAGLPVLSQATLIDNFDSYNNSVVQNIGAHSNGDATSGVWDGVFDGTSNGLIVDADPGNNALQALGIPSQGSGGWRGAVTDLANNFSDDHSLADGDSATYFFQVRNEGNAYADTMIGLTENTGRLDINNAWQDFSVRPVVKGSPGSAVLDVNGTTVASLVDGEWRNVWLVVDNSSKTFDVYTSTGQDDGALALAGVTFNTITNPLDLAAFGIAGRENGRVTVDNIFTAPGEFTGNPLAPGGGSVYSTEVLGVAGDVLLESGAVVSFGVAGSGVNDRLEIGGGFTAGGLLQVQLVNGAPAPEQGDSFDLFDFASASGAFDEYDLPELGAGLRWDTSGLTEEGSLLVSVALAGDFNENGVVDAADFTVWRDRLGQTGMLAYAPGDGDGDGDVDIADYGVWVANFGATAATQTVAIPEPLSASLLALGLAALGRSRPLTRRRPRHAVRRPTRSRCTGRRRRPRASCRRPRRREGRTSAARAGNAGASSRSGAATRTASRRSCSSRSRPIRSPRGTRSPRSAAGRTAARRTSSPSSRCGRLPRRSP
ncbi:Autotransporter-associated beta strand repeat protein [Pseudobythopirellula maris]|uniref:Autotransporter-associated beta strand repeat protein n=1 Tax=Pseudobythopirellula maris TaxID=2527991 RepID=A0A5C5ZUT9_9BACT|nr:Autotransporter-associated beta strand repeat protein [Pseudobythopirellula maris]